MVYDTGERFDRAAKRRQQIAVGVSPWFRVAPPPRASREGGGIDHYPLATDHYPLPFCFKQVSPPPCRADHSRVKQRTFMTFPE